MRSLPVNLKKKAPVERPGLFNTMLSWFQTAAGLPHWQSIISVIAWLVAGAFAFANLHANYIDRRNAAQEKRTTSAKADQNFALTIELVERINAVSAQLAATSSPLAQIASEIGIPEAELRFRISELSNRPASSPADQLIRAKALLAEGLYDQSTAAAQAVIRQESSLELKAEANFVIAIAHLRQGYVATAQSHLKKALSDVSSIKPALRSQLEKTYSWTLLNSGRPADALVTYMDAIKREWPQPSPSLPLEDNLALGQILLAAGEIDHASRFAGAAFNNANDNLARKDIRLSLALILLAQIELGRNRLDEAESITRKYLGLLKETDRLESIEAGIGFYYLGKIMRTKGNIDEARSQYEKCLRIYEAQLNSDHTQIALTLNELGLCDLNSVDWKDALSYFNKAIAIADRAQRDDPFTYSMFVANRGRAFLLGRDLDQARDAILKARAFRRTVVPENHPAIADLDKLMLDWAL